MTEPVVCPVCGRSVPPGRYCAACGARLPQYADTSSRRLHSFTVNPFEHVFHPSPVSLLFPHLPQDESVGFRLALLVISAALILVGYLRLSGASVALAAAAVPVLFLVFLVDVEVFQRRPWLTTAVTAGAGALLGAIWAYLTGHYVSQTELLNATRIGVPVGRVLLVAVVFPVVMQALMLAGPAALRGLKAYDEVLDGFVAGAASAMGFVLTSTLVNLFPLAQSGPVTTTGDIFSAIITLIHGLVVPLIWGGTTGLVSAVIWLRSGPMRPLPAGGWSIGYPFVLGIAILAQVILGFAAIYVQRVSSALLIYSGVGLGVLFISRYSLHHMLLAEAVEPPSGGEMLCAHCGHVVPRGAFCLDCGGSHLATPKRGADGSRQVR
jgi:hypothetical protein